MAQNQCIFHTSIASVGNSRLHDGKSFPSHTLPFAVALPSHMDDPDLLGDKNQNMTLEQVFQFIEAKESGKYIT